MKRKPTLAIGLGVLLVTGIATLWQKSGLPDPTLASPHGLSAPGVHPPADTGDLTTTTGTVAEPAATPVLPGKNSPRPELGKATAALLADQNAPLPPVPPLPIDTSLVAKIAAANEAREEITFPLPGGGTAKGKVEWSQQRDGVTVLVQGPLTAPQPGFFFFSIPPEIGVAGELVGFVRFDAGEVAYRVEPNKDGKPEFVQRDIDEIMCRNLVRHDDGVVLEQGVDAAPETGNGFEIEHAPEDHPANTATGNIPAYQNCVVSLQSLPGAPGVLYLDFDGEKGPFPGWGNYDAAHSGLTNAQIRDTWEHIAEDFAPFNLNVTTDLKAFQDAPATSRIRCVISPSSPYESGVAYIGSFNWASDTVCWAGYRGGKVGWEVTSHELGHALGLAHDGRTGIDEYYGGQGSGEVGWSTIMGNSYYKNLTQWSKGEYAGANNLQDDLAIITNNNNNVDYRADDHGNDFAGGTYLEILAANAVSNQGVIETGADVDTLRFTTTATGNVSLAITQDPGSGNLDILAEIVRSSDGAVISSANPDTLLDATVTATNLAAGTYFLRVSGVGRGNPAVDGYSDYGSLGHYKVSGTVPNGIQPNRMSIAENSVNGTVVGTVTPRNNHGGATLAYAIASGNGLGAFAINATTGQLTVTSSAALDYESLSTRYDDPATIELFVSITNSSNPSLNETVRVVVSATDVNEAHTIGGPSIAQVAGSSPAGTLFASYHVEGPDQFDTVAWSITSGNSSGAFAINPDGGLILANPAAVTTPGSYTLQLTATDNGPPSPVITANRSITVQILRWSPGQNVLVRNWAREPGATASQSSTASGGSASRAIDGNTNGNWTSNSVTHTDNLSNSWWEVDLGALRAIASVQLFNRTDAVGTRLSNFKISVLDASRGEVAAQSFYEGSGSVGGAELWTLAVPATGRYVRVQLLGNNNDGNGVLSLAEVIVTEALAPNVALASAGGVATQSTTAYGGVASRAIDGITDGSSSYTTHTAGSPNDWWQVDLDAPYNIDQIVFYNRTDSTASRRLSNFKVSVWNGATEVYSSSHFTDPGTWAGTSFSLSQISGIVGDRVKIEHLGLNNIGDRFLQLAEVKVHATPLEKTWTNAVGGSWPTAGNWLSNDIGNGHGCIASFATLNLTADATVTLDGARTIGGLTFGDTTSSHNWILNTGGAGPLTLSAPGLSPVTVNNQTATINAVLAGTNGMRKAGLGALTLGAANTFSGGAVISHGTLRMGGNMSLGSNSVTLGDAFTGTASVAWLFPGGATPSNAVTVANQGSGTVTLGTYSGGLFTQPTSPLTLNRAVTLHDGTGDRTSFSGKISGPVGTITLTGSRVTFDNATNDFTGNVIVANGTIYQNNAANAVPDATTFTLNGSSARFRLANNSETIGGLDGSGIVDNVTGSGNTLTVGGGNATGTFTGTLVNGSGTLNFAKTGSGTQTLGGANTYTGTTVIGGGTLLVNGSLSTGATTVQSGATLAGSGTLRGATTVNVGATLAPGVAGIGTLTINNAVTLAGTGVMEIGKSGATLTSDRVSGVTTLTHGGTLTVTKVGADALVMGDSFTLFGATTRTGSFSTVDLPVLTSGLAWDQSQLTTHGIITVRSADDVDGDGFTNALEVTLGTNPNSSASQPAAIYSGLRAWWRLNETSGSTADDTTGRSQDGTLVNSPTWTAGINGNGLALNGTNQSVSVPDLAQNTNTLTISAWVKRNGSQVNWAGLIFSRSSVVSGLNISTDNKLGYHWNDSSSTYNFNSGLTLPDATWTFCAVVVESTKATLYMQPSGGSMQSIVNTLSHPVAAFGANLYLGQDPMGGRFFKGSMDQVMVHNRALNATEIGQLYTAGTTSPGLVDPYASWVSARGVTGAGDSDDDGIPNLLEFYLDGDPLAADVSILPVAAMNGDFLILSFNRRDDAENLGTGAAVQWSSDFANWTEVPLGSESATANADGVTVEVEEHGEAPDTITVAIPCTLAIGGQLFARLKIAE